MTLRAHAPHAKRQWTALFVILALAMGLMATTVLAAPPKISLEQCRNGGADAPNDCLQLGGGTGWQNGNSGASTAHFVEGHSIPYRTIITDGPQGSNTVTLGYDIKHSGANAIDFLTHFDRLLPHGAFDHGGPELVDPTDGVNGLGSDVAECAIPLPTNLAGTDAATSFAAIVAAGDHLFTVYGADSCSVVEVTPGDLGAAQSEARVDVTFNATSSTIVMAWGGHIAKSSDWDGNGAAEVSGSPYHMRLKAWTAGNVGNQDRSLSAAAVIQETSTTTTQPSATADFTATLNDSATVTGDSPTGTVTFNLWSTKSGDPAVCSGLLYTEVVQVEADGTAETTGVGSFGSNEVSPTSSTTYYWTADYSGDDGNESSSSDCGEESVTVNPPTFSFVPTTP